MYYKSLPRIPMGIDHVMKSISVGVRDNTICAEKVYCRRGESIFDCCKHLGGFRNYYL